MKRACVARLGAYGDMIIASPLFPFLKRDGYHVTAYIAQRGEPIVRHNPYIDKVVYHDDAMPIEELDKHFEETVKDS